MTDRRSPGIAALATLTALVLAACGDDDGGNGGGDIEPTFTSIWENVLSDEDRCLQCHDSTVTSDFFETQYREGGELDFSDRDVAYDLLVGEAADGVECDGVGTLVVPGDPDLSILVSKVEDEEPVCGDMMPIVVEEGVTGAEIAAIREWIRLGAADD